MTDFAEYIKIAQSANEMASDFLVSRFGPVKTMNNKSGNHFGIKEDGESSKIYEDYFRTNSPEVALYTEEGEKNLNSDLVWVIDPIEGTSNYRVGIPFWGTQVALLYKGEPVMGVVNAPILKQKFFATKGNGAFLNDKKISVSKLTELDKALIDIVRGTKDEDKDWAVRTLQNILKKVRTNRAFGACGVDICYAAAGLTDIYINKGSNLYDLAAGAIIAKEAGAEVLNFEGDSWSIEDDSFLVANSVLAKDILKLLP